MSDQPHPLAGAVKPLEWTYTDEATGRMYGKADHYSAVAITVDGIGKSGLPTRGTPICYTIWPKDPTINQQERGMTGRRFGVNFNGFEVRFLENSTLETAKAAAQADYAARILSALEAPTPPADVAELVEIKSMAQWLYELPCCEDEPRDTTARCRQCERSVADTLRALSARIESLEAALQAADAAIEDALGRHQVTHIHAALTAYREARHQKGYDDER